MKAGTSDAWADAIDDHRGPLFGYAYRMLSSASEAEDVLQDAWVKVRAVAFDSVDNPRAFLFTSVSRLCLDRLRKSHRKREQYVGPWLPEPILTAAGSPVPTAPTAEDRLDTAESISMAFLVLLDTLSATERAAWILHRVFDFPYREVASAIGKEEAAVRKAGSRAQKKVTDARPMFASTKEEHAALFAAFGAALASGEVAALQTLLVDDVLATSDGGGKVSASTQVLAGRDRVSTFLFGIMRVGTTAETNVVPAEVNGWPAALVFEGDRLSAMVDLETDGARVHAVRIVRNPEKLARAQAQWESAQRDAP